MHIYLKVVGWKQTRYKDDTGKTYAYPYFNGVNLNTYVS